MPTDRTYVIKRLPPGTRPRDWDDPVWETATPLRVDNFHPRSTDHHPDVEARLLYDDAELHVRFRVQDRYVRATHIGYQAMVCRDSCVEFFVTPKPGAKGAQGGYFNFETNCGGSLLLWYVEDHTITPSGFAKSTPVDAELARGIRILHSMPPRVDPEIAEPTLWHVQLGIPFALFEHYVGPLDVKPGTPWEANLYKCADETSHPHWGSWSPVMEKCNFHQPELFGVLEFGK